MLLGNHTVEGLQLERYKALRLENPSKKVQELHQ